MIQQISQAVLDRLTQAAATGSLGYTPRIAAGNGLPFDPNQTLDMPLFWVGLSWTGPGREFGIGWRIPCRVAILVGTPANASVEVPNTHRLITDAQRLLAGQRFQGLLAVPLQPWRTVPLAAAMAGCNPVIPPIIGTASSVADGPAAGIYCVEFRSAYDVAPVDDLPGLPEFSSVNPQWRLNPPDQPESDS